MINVFDNYIISDEICERIKTEYFDKIDIVETGIRKQKNYNERNTTSWLYNTINKLIKNTLGSTYKLTERVTVLKYEAGDFFLEHQDGPHNTSLNSKLPYHFYGGVELNNRSDFDGGEFYINGIDVEYKKGRMFTHGFSDFHGVREVNSGERWSLHFPINYKTTKLI